MDTPLPDRYKHHRFPAEIISHGVWLYFCFCLSYRDSGATISSTSSHGD